MQSSSGPSWHTSICFVLAGMIFVLCQIIVSGTRPDSEEPALGQAGDRSYEDGNLRKGFPAGSYAETEGRRTLAD